MIVKQISYKNQDIEVHSGEVPGSFYTTINGVYGGCWNSCSVDQAEWAAKASVDHSLGLEESYENF